MSGEVGMEDKLLNQMSCRVKQDILKNNKTQYLRFAPYVWPDQFTTVLSTANRGASNCR